MLCTQDTCVVNTGMNIFISYPDNYICILSYACCKSKSQVAYIVHLKIKSYWHQELKAEAAHCFISEEGTHIISSPILAWPLGAPRAPIWVCTTRLPQRLATSLRLHRPHWTRCQPRFPCHHLLAHLCNFAMVYRFSGSLFLCVPEVFLWLLFSGKFPYDLFY